MLTEFDLHLFGEGTLHRAFEKLGAHRREVDGQTGVHFAVWAPNADAGERDRRLQRLELAHASDAQPWPQRHLGDVRARGRRRRALQIRSAVAG